MSTGQIYWHPLDKPLFLLRIGKIEERRWGLEVRVNYVEVRRTEDRGESGDLN